MPTFDLASKYSQKVDEQFQRAAIKNLVTNQDYEWTGVDTVKVYSIGTATMNNYSRTGANRYGTPSELSGDTQTMQIRKDRSWTFTIDKLNKNQRMMVDRCPLAA